jgi:aminomethyltransferase
VTALRTTPLHARHRELGAKMIDFGGWDMPVQYTGIIEEHRAVRARAGVFDVSHMGQIDVAGDDAAAFLQSVLSNDLGRIVDNHAQYTLLTNEQGGITDDLIAYRIAADRYLLVVNAANTATDEQALRARCPASVTLTNRSDEFGMLALQGPAAPAVLEAVGILIGSLPSFGFTTTRIGDADCIVARTGYTGEWGVEILTPASGTEQVFDRLLAQRACGVVPCGLGARDTLRLEVCYPLHGNDIDAATDAISAGLGWVCALDKQFVGVDALRRVRTDGPARRLVAFRMVDRAIPRSGMSVHAEDGVVIGRVTSGTISPSLDQGVGMGYVDASSSAPDTSIMIDVRGRLRAASVAEKPLYRKEP